MQTIISEEYELNHKNKITIDIKIETLLGNSEYATLVSAVKEIKKTLIPYFNEIEKKLKKET